MKRKRTRIALGVYRDQWGLSATVKVDGKQREQRFPKDTSLRTIRAWQDQMRVALRSIRPTRPRTNFDSDAKSYLAGVRMMPSYRERERNIGLWVDERGGPRNLDSGFSEISIVFQAAVPKPVVPKYTTSGVRRPSER